MWARPNAIRVSASYGIDLLEDHKSCFDFSPYCIALNGRTAAGNSDGPMLEKYL